MPIDEAVTHGEDRPMMQRAAILTEGYAGLQAQALGLAEAAGLAPEPHVLRPRTPWRLVSSTLWPRPLAAVPDLPVASMPGLVIGAGGVAGAVGAALRRGGRRVVHIQNPRLDPRRFDLLVVNQHDDLTGPNVVVIRTALHRASEARLRQAAQDWAPRMEHLPRPLVAVLVGGTNGRFRLDAPVAEALAGQLAVMLRADRVGIALTPSRRTDPAAARAFARILSPLGAMVWDGSGDNPYFGLLALADAIIVTIDSVSMISEALATRAPVMLAPLPGRSRRIGRFADGLIADGRVRRFIGRCETWPVSPFDDTAWAASELRRRLGL